MAHEVCPLIGMDFLLYHFTGYAQAIVTKNQTAKTTADALFHNFIVHYGISQKIHSNSRSKLHEPFN
jgi:hypothetical protein